MTRRIVSLFLCVLLCCVFAGAMADEALELTDMTGRTVRLSAPAARIVVLQPSDCEVLFAIGAGETVIGRGAYCDYPDKAATIPVVNAGSEMNIEQIIALMPQVVVMSKMDHSVDQVEQLENAGIRVVVTDPQTIEGVYDCIELLGQLTGSEERAASLIESMQDRFAAVREKADGNGRTVYFEVSELKWGLWAAGNNTFLDELAQLCGLHNVFSDVTGWGAVSEEQVLARNPDIIVTTTAYYGDGPLPEEEIMSRIGWDNVNAVKSGVVFAADANMITRPGPRLADAAEALCSFICENKNNTIE